MQLLGYDKNELAKKLELTTTASSENVSNGGVDASELAEKMATLDTSVSFMSL